MLRPEFVRRKLQLATDDLGHLARFRDMSSPNSCVVPDGVRRVAYDERFLDQSWLWLRDAEIRRLTATPDFTREQQRAWFDGLSARTDYAVWGIEADGQPIGVFGIKHITTDTAEYWGYIGERAHWARGIGQWMLDSATAEARARGLGRLYLRVISDNERARRAYERFGFETTAVDDEIITMTLPLV